MRGEIADRKFNCAGRATWRSTFYWLSGAHLAAYRAHSGAKPDQLINALPCQ